MWIPFSHASSINMYILIWIIQYLNCILYWLLWHDDCKVWIVYTLDWVSLEFTYECIVIGFLLYTSKLYKIIWNKKGFETNPQITNFIRSSWWSIQGGFTGLQIKNKNFNLLKKGTLEIGTTFNPFIITN